MRDIDAFDKTSTFFPIKKFWMKFQRPKLWHHFSFVFVSPEKKAKKWEHSFDLFCAVQTRRSFVLKDNAIYFGRRQRFVLKDFAIYPSANTNLSKHKFPKFTNICKISLQICVKVFFNCEKLILPILYKYFWVSFSLHIYKYPKRDSKSWLKNCPTKKYW
jgi:hypothetical protein